MKTRKPFASLFAFCLSIAFSASAATPPLTPPLFGWQVWPGSGERIVPASLPPVSATNAKVRVVTARGVVASASFAVRSMAAFKSLTIEPGPLATADGETLSLEGLDLRVVKCWYQDANGWFAAVRAPGKAILVPELLLHDDTLVRTDPKTRENLVRTSPAGAAPVYQRLRSGADGAVVPTVSFVAADDAATLQPLAIARKECRQFYLTLPIPVSAKPGVYRGKLSFRGDGRDLGHIDFGVSVIDHLLPAASSRFSGRGSLDGGKVVSGSSPAPITTTPEPFRAVVVPPAGDHSAATIAAFAAIGLSEPVLSAADLSKAKELFGGRLPGTLWVAEPGVLATEPSGAPAPAVAAGLAKDALATGVEDVRVFLPARPSGEGLAADLKSIEAVDDTGARAWVFVTDETYRPGAALIRSPMRRGYPKTAENVGSRIHGANTLDGSCYGVVEYSDTRPCERWRAVGAPFYLYSTLPVGVEDPSVWRRRLGLECFYLGYEGFVLDRIVEADDPWNDWRSAEHRSRTFLYPTKSGYLPTLAWEGLRDAVVDVRYLSSMRRLAEAVRYAGMKDPRVDIEGRKAARWLEGLPVKKAALDTMRLDAMAWIMRLQDVLEIEGR